MDEKDKNFSLKNFFTVDYFNQNPVRFPWNFAHMSN